MSSVRRAALTYAAYFTAIGASWAYLPVYYRELGLGLATIGLLSAMSAAIQLVAAPAWGVLADRFPHSRLGLPAAALVAAAGASGLAFSGEPIALALSVAILALGSAGIGPVLDARTLEILGDRAARYGEVRAIGSLAFVVATLAVGVLLDQAGTRALFVVFVPTLVGTALAAFSLPRRGGGRRPGVWHGVGTFVRTPGVAAFLLGTLLTWALLSAANAFYSIQIVALGGSAQLVGIAWAIGAAVEVPVMWGHRRLAARIGAGPILVLGALAFAARAALAAVAPNAAWLVAITPMEGLAYALFTVGGVGFVSARAPAGLAATAQGVFSATLGLAQIAGSAFGGIVAASTDIATLFAIAAIGGFLAAGVVALAARAPGRGTRAAVPASGPAGARPALDESPNIVSEEVHP